MRYPQRNIKKLADRVAESMRKRREKTPRLAIERVFNDCCIPISRDTKKGGYREGSVAKQVSQELQRRSVVVRKRNTEKGMKSGSNNRLFPTSLFEGSKR